MYYPSNDASGPWFFLLAAAGFLPPVVYLFCRYARKGERGKSRGFWPCYGIGFVSVLLLVPLMRIGS